MEDNPRKSNKTVSIIVLLAALLALVVLIIYVGRLSGGKSKTSSVYPVRAVIPYEIASMFEDIEITNLIKEGHVIEPYAVKVSSYDILRGLSTASMDLFVTCNPLVSEKFASEGVEVSTETDLCQTPLIFLMTPKTSEIFDYEGLGYIEDDGTATMNMEAFSGIISGIYYLHGIDSLPPDASIKSPNLLYTDTGLLLWYTLIESVLQSEDFASLELTEEEILTNLLAKIDDRKGVTDILNNLVTEIDNISSVVCVTESDLVYYANTYPSQWEKIKDKVLMIYPDKAPALHFSVVGVTDYSQAYMLAMASPDISELIGNKLGFRTVSGSLPQLTDDFIAIGMRQWCDADNVTPSLERARYYMKTLSDLKTKNLGGID